MCWNATVSLNTFLFSLFITIISYYNNVITLPYALYFCSFFTMQLIEYFIWKGYNNRLFSLLGLIAILSQPIFALMIINDNYTKIVLISLYIILSVIYYTINNNVDFSTVIAKNGHLKWNWFGEGLLFNIIWASFMLIAVVYTQNIYILLFFTISYAICYYTYYKYGSIGSMWCWFANLVFVYLFYLIVKKSLLCY